MIRLANRAVRLTVAPSFGCRWMRLQIKTGGRWTDVLVPASLTRLRKDPFFDGGYLMAPWCNRLPRARFRFRGQRHQLRVNFPDGSAIHGDVLARPWRVRRRTAAALTAELDSRRFRDFNFPWPVVVRHGVRVTARGVSAWISVTNAGRAPFPAGVGFHPFFRRSLGGPADLTVPPKKTRRVTKARFDDSVPWPARAVRLDYRKAGLALRLHPGKNARHLFVWTPTTFRGRTPDFFCVEPMTMKVGSFERLAPLRPGKTLTLRWRLEARAI